jgi:hypothetical protein
MMGQRGLEGVGGWARNVRNGSGVNKAGRELERKGGKKGKKVVWGSEVERKGGGRV